MPMSRPMKNIMRKAVPKCSEPKGKPNGFTSKQHISPKVQYKINYPQKDKNVVGGGDLK